MKEYIRTLDHCPFCKEKLLFKHRRSRKPKDRFIGLCRNNHAFKKTDMSIIVYGSSNSNIDNCFLGIRMNLKPPKEALCTYFYLGKHRDRTRIFETHAAYQASARSSINLDFNKLISFSFEEEEFKNKLLSLIAFS